MAAKRASASKPSGKQDGKRSGFGSLGPHLRVLVLTGAERFLVLERTRELHAAFSKANGVEPEVFRFEGRTPPATVLDECRSVGLMSSFKLVIVDDAQDLMIESQRPIMERYAQDPSPDACLVLRAGGFHFPKFLGILAERADTADLPCTPASDAEALKWCSTLAQRHGFRLDADAARLLVERTGTDLGILDTEIAKLAAAAIAFQLDRISAQLVVQFSGETREESAWSIQSQMLGGRAEPILEALHAVLDRSSSDSHIPVTWAAVDLASKLHGVAAMVDSGVDPYEAAGALRLWGPSRTAVAAVANRLSRARTIRLLDDAIATDVAGKTGLGDAERNLERLMLRFAEELRAR